MSEQSEAEKAAEEYVESRERLSACQACNTRSNRVGHEHYKAFLAGVAWAAPKWVSVKERLPGEYKTVLAMLAGTTIPSYGFRRGHGSNCWGICDDAGEFAQYLNSEVTHWMEFPAAPEVEK